MLAPLPTLNVLTFNVFDIGCAFRESPQVRLFTCYWEKTERQNMSWTAETPACFSNEILRNR